MENFPDDPIIACIERTGYPPEFDDLVEDEDDIDDEREDG